MQGLNRRIFNPITDTYTCACTYTHDIEYAGVHKVLEQLQRANTPTPKVVFVFPPHVHPQENQKPEEKEERGVESVAQVSEEEADRQHLEEEELRASSPSCPSYSTPLTPPSQRDLCTKADLLGNKSDEQHSSHAPEEEWREVVYPPVWREVVCPPEGAKGALGETRETCARQTAPSSLDILPGREGGREGGRGGGGLLRTNVHLVSAAVEAAAPPGP